MKKLILWTGILLLVPVLTACLEETTGIWIKLGGSTQGTSYNITYQTPDSANYQEDLERVLAGFDRSLSTYLDSSLISRFNRGEEGLSPDAYFRECFQAAGEVYRSTGGAFDITVAPIVNAWGFGFTEGAEIDSALIDSLLDYVGMDRVRIEQGTIRKDRDGIMLDMNAIAQGYAVDVLAEFLDSLGILNYLVEIGGEVRCRGHNPRGIAWRVGIDKPIDGMQVAGIEMQAVVGISDRSLATSGNYRRFYVKDGMKYSHTIDPKTGYPVQHGLLSATVLADDCMKADAYATAFMVMGFEQSREFLQKQSLLEAYLIYNDEKGEYRVWYTDGMKKYIRREKD